MNIENNTFPEPQGFSVQDILWAIGVWSVILTPVTGDHFLHADGGVSGTLSDPTSS